MTTRRCPILVLSAVAYLAAAAAPIARARDSQDQRPAAPRVLRSPVAPGGDPRQTRIALQAALDSFDAGHPVSNANPGGVLVLAPGDYRIDRPLMLDRPNVSIRGMGRTLTRLSSSTAHDLLAVAVARAPFGAKPEAGSLPDLWTAGPGGSPLLDATAVPGPGKRRGIRTFGTSHLRQQGGPLDQGIPPGNGQAWDHYAAIPALTLDLAVDFSRVDPAKDATLCGMQDRTTGKPFFLLRRSGSLVLFFSTGDGRVDRGTHRLWMFPAPPLKAFHRISVQVDLAAATATAWADGKQLATVPNQGPPLAPGRFLPNEHTPYTIGFGQDPAGGSVDLTFAGHKLTGAALYKVGAPGDAQARVDGKPLTDLLRYFAGERLTIAYLPLDDDPADAIASRVLSACNGAGQRSSLYLLDNAKHGNGWGTKGTSIHELGLRSRGRCVALGTAWNLDIRDCEMQSSSHAIGSLSFGGAWPLLVRDCDLMGGDSPLHLWFAVQARLEGLVISGNYRAGLRLVDCDFTARDVFGSGQGTSDFGVKLVRCMGSMERCGFDGEAPGSGAQVASIYASSGQEQQSYYLRVRGWGESQAGPQSSFLMLEDGGSNVGRPNRVTVEDLSIADVTRRALVNYVGGNWTGTVTADSPVTKARLSIGKTGVVVNGTSASPGGPK